VILTLTLQDEDGWTALIAATCYNHEDVVKVDLDLMFAALQAGNLVYSA
jgi:hypothetical protein